MYIDLFSGDTFTYSTNVALSNSYSWAANAQVVSLDLAPIVDVNNTNVGLLSCNLSSISTATPNAINYTLTYSANSYATTNWLANSVNLTERVLYLFTQFTSNTGIIQHSNVQIVKVKASLP